MKEPVEIKGCFEVPKPAPRVVWKYQFDLTSEVQIFSIPAQSKVVHADVQDGKPTLWIEVTPSFNAWEHRFQIIGTGWELPSDAKTHVGTVIINDEVWHIYNLIG